ncbi:MAG: MFS transporter [Pseudomonadota bacterium]
MTKGNLRFWVVGLVAIATIINYIDRGALGVLWPDIKAEYGFTNQDYANIGTVFVLAYAFGQGLFGKIFDWIGTRIGFVLSIGVWSIATALHALATGVGSFALFRGILGVAEAGNWPGAAKANAEWFPINERALAQGIFNSGAAIGGIVSPPLLALLAVFLGWKAIFVVIGLVGLLWLIPWLIIYKSKPETHPWLTEEERSYILSGQRVSSSDDEENDYNPSTGEMLGRKETWGAILPAMFIDPIWWLFVFWIPIYLIDTFGFDVAEIGLYGWVPYVGAMLGAWFGGLLAQNRLNSGWSVNKTRKMVITLGGLIMLPALFSMSVASTPTLAVLIMAIILFGFQTAIGNVQTLPSDLYSKKAVGSLAGYAGTAAKLAAAGLVWLVPRLTEAEKYNEMIESLGLTFLSPMAANSYMPAFVIGAALAVLAVASVWLFIPRIEPLKPKAA